MDETRTTASGTTDAAFREGHPSPSRAMEIAVAVGGLVLMAVVLVLAQQIELRREATPGQIDARFWPVTLAWAGIVTAACRLVVVLIRPADQRVDLEQVQVRGPLRLLLTVVLTVVFIAAWNLREVVFVGYELRVFPYAAAILLALLAWLYGGRTWRSLLLFPALTTALTYVVFGTLLRIPL